MNLPMIQVRNDDVASEPAVRPAGTPAPLAVAGATANGSVPRLGQRCPCDYAGLLVRPLPPQGTCAAAGGRPEHARPDGGLGLGYAAPAGWPDYGPK